MKVVILAGGLGTRFREETEFKPKPMIDIGHYPILVHLLKYYLALGHTEFVICGGYKVNQIKDYFTNLSTNLFDIEINYGTKTHINFLSSEMQNFKVTVVDTGKDTPTGERLLKIRDLLVNEQFLCTYGDGLSNIKLAELISLHNSSNAIATLSAVQPKSRFGILDLDGDKVNKFDEKPISLSWVNAGFFIFNPEIFNYIKVGQMLEEAPLKKLAEEGRLGAYRHNDFWQPMDTYRDWLVLEELWNSGKAPWKIW